ncbi:flavodoxin family protein [Sporomusa acidovorans]|uniref:NADPH-dependent FMN reductase-like domain-containing protein n=1 Tax=Sporomusa acidovorans (strain ATCC 49682 / DSM 3132 / Mol) TaxID=1123286 RepID=A0ABZ3J1C5_SPOA4|nr:flavodoxin family protein [Sporomusa acidovorans]OZC24151.1 FMN-dependent NADH-azoreductase [Sporomusa acidovorans DSM 3132]SDF37361.1 NADPH-dependent FMN reductase [Sporomusa acidovorans]
MDRREFLKVSGMGTLTLFLSSCGLYAMVGNKENENKVPEKGSVSGGKSMKIVVINSSPHPKNESTSIYLSGRLTEGAESAGHAVFTFDAANENTHPCRGCDKCHMDGPCVWQDDIEKKLMPKMLEADLLVLVTPLYYYGMSAQLKTVIDRFYSRTGKLHGKKSVLLATAYNSADWTIHLYWNWINYPICHQRMALDRP